MTSYNKENSSNIRNKVLTSRRSFREAQTSISQELDNLQGIKDRLIAKKSSYDELTYNKRLEYVNHQIDLQLNDLKYKKAQVQLLDEILESNDSDQVIVERLREVFE